MMQKSLRVEGMTCQHCVQIISDSLNNRAGIEKVDVNIDKKEVKVEYDEEKIELDHIFSEVSALGFEIVEDSKKGE